MSGAGVSLEAGCPLWEDNTEDGRPGVRQAPLPTARPSPSCVPPAPVFLLVSPRPLSQEGGSTILCLLSFSHPARRCVF